MRDLARVPKWLTDHVHGLAKLFFSLFTTCLLYLKMFQILHGLLLYLLSYLTSLLVLQNWTFAPKNRQILLQAKSFFRPTLVRAYIADRFT